MQRLRRVSIYWPSSTSAPAIMPKPNRSTNKLLEIRQKVLRPVHPDTAVSLDNLASLYREMGDYAKAEPLCRQALEIRQKVLGPEHPDTLIGLNNLATALPGERRVCQGRSVIQRELGNSAKGPWSGASWYHNRAEQPGDPLPGEGRVCQGRSAVRQRVWKFGKGSLVRSILIPRPA